MIRLSRWLVLSMALTLGYGAAAAEDWPAEGYWTFYKTNALGYKSYELWRGRLLLTADVSALVLEYHQKDARGEAGYFCIYRVGRDPGGAPVVFDLVRDKRELGLRCHAVGSVGLFGAAGAVSVTHLGGQAGSPGHLTRGTAFPMVTVWRSEQGAPADIEPLTLEVMDVRPGQTRPQAEAALALRGYVPFGTAEAIAGEMVDVTPYGRDPDQGLQPTCTDCRMDPMDPVPDFRDVLLVSYLTLPGQGQKVVSVQREVLFRPGNAPSVAALQQDLERHYPLDALWEDIARPKAEDALHSSRNPDRRLAGAGVPGCGPPPRAPDFAAISSLTISGLGARSIFGSGLLTAGHPPCGVTLVAQVGGARGAVDADWFGTLLSDGRLVRWIAMHRERAYMADIVAPDPAPAAGSGPLPEL